MCIKLEKIIDKSGNLYGYELLKTKPSNSFEDFFVFKYLLDFVKQNGVRGLIYHINIYPKTLITFYEDIKNINIPDNVVFELIENNSTVPNENLEEVINKLNIKISIDDFGTGSSNFHRLELPNIVSVKFERNLWNDERYIPIITHLIEELNKNNILPLAEKVETDIEWQKTKNLGFYLFQGYYWK